MSFDRSTPLGAGTSPETPPNADAQRIGHPAADEPRSHVDTQEVGHPASDELHAHGDTQGVGHSAADGPRAPALTEAYAECERVARASRSSFRHAFRLLPGDRRRALAALYAFCRVVDDAADEGGGPAALATWRIELDRALAGRAPRHPITVALADAVSRFAIPPVHLDEILTGVEMDLAQRRYETFDELRRYCYHVAGAVGLATIPILGCRHPRSRAYAEALGIALQLTNILRDLAEDAERGRIYLPLEDLRRFGYRERELLTHARTPSLTRLVRFECVRAREFYRAARGSITPEDRRALAPAEGMRLVYQRLLGRIARRPDAVFGPRITVPLREKMACTVIAWVRTRRGARRRPPSLSAEATQAP